MNGPCPIVGNNGPWPNKYCLNSAAVALATATGMMLRGLRSNKSSSIASNTDEIGAANVADIPAAAPATRSVFRSVLVR